MALRKAAPPSPQSVASTRSTRSSRSNTLVEPPPPLPPPPPPEKKPASQRRPVKSANPAKKAVAKRVTRAARASGHVAAKESESGTDADKEDDGDDGDPDKAEVEAPSGILTRKRGHQTGLSLTLSKTTLEALPRGTKRELSAGNMDGVDSRPTKAAKHQSPPPLRTTEESEDDDDDVYDAVNDISESDESESEIEREEEKNIIASVESKRAASVDSWAGFTLDGIAVDDESPFFSENFAVTEPNSEIDLTPADAVTAQHASPSPSSAPTRRRVRFAGIGSSSTSTASQDSEIDEAAFPDLLLDAENLHESTRQLFDIEEATAQLSDESFWEFDANREMPPPRSKGSKALEESSDGFSGYETDSSSGQTTDDEAVPPLTVHRPHHVLRLNPEGLRNRVTRVRSTPSPTALGKAPKGPCMGTWIADPSKPIGVIHPRTKRMIYIAPHVSAVGSLGARATSSADSSPPTGYIDMASVAPWQRRPSARKNSDSDSSVQADGPENPFSMFHGYSAVMPVQPVGAFFDGAIEEDDDEEDPHEAQLDIEAFIDFGQHDSDSPDGDLDGEADDFASPMTPLSTQRLPTITPKRSRGRSSSQNLLEHFDKGIVSAFRRNQTRHQAVLKRPVAGTRLQAIKGGRQMAANAPISPLRKRKGARSMSSSMAPFTGINTSRLRSGTA